MRALSICCVLVVICSTNRAQPADEAAKKQLQSDDYTVIWNPARTFEPAAELEIGNGGGHGGALSWVRFQPSKGGVDVLSIQFDQGRHPYKSTWPPDRAPVAVKRSRMTADAYAALLLDLAAVDAAELKPVEGKAFWSSTGDFWVYARLTTPEKTYLDLDWAGYDGSWGSLEFAKLLAVVNLAREAIKRLDFQDHTLTVEDRAWGTAKFARDWKKFKGRDFHWWVRERYIQTIGVVGDEAVLPVLREIITAEHPTGLRRDASDGRCVYYAINAVTRLTKQDVRDQPIEEMDIEKTRLKILELIKDKK